MKFEVINKIAPPHAAVADPQSLTLLDHYLAPDIRMQIETRYWHDIESTAALEPLLDDATFIDNPGRHLGFFADHSCVHARDIAMRAINLLDSHNGHLFERRTADRLTPMKCYVALLAFLHDVGMVHPTPSGRKMHAQFAAQLVFNDDFGELIPGLLHNNALAGYLNSVCSELSTELSPAVLLREILAMSLCHSKSTLPQRILEEPGSLRLAMCTSLFTSIETLAEAERKGSWLEAEWDNRSAYNKHYQYNEYEPYSWLLKNSPIAEQFIADIVDTLKVLRTADALRQRGTQLRTSAGYEVFMDRSGSAIFAVASQDGQVAVHLRIDSPMSVGEANIDDCTLELNGDLMLGFHRGAFDVHAHQSVVDACAKVTLDIVDDVMGLFRLAENARLLLRAPPDNPFFTLDLQQRLTKLRPQLADNIKTLPYLDNLPGEERLRYQHATPLLWPSDLATRLIDQLALRGNQTAQLDLNRCFIDVRVAEISAGEILMAVNENSTFVYIPIDDGIELESGAGFGNQNLLPWTLLGSTGVIRNGVRNSTVRANINARVIMIPGEVYYQEWFAPYSIKEIHKLVNKLQQQEPA